MNGELNVADLDVVIESLNYYKTRVVDSTEYPSFKFKEKQLERVETTIRKVTALRNELD
jgi:hypothetical protein